MQLVKEHGISALDIYRSFNINPEEESAMSIDVTLNLFAWERVLQEKRAGAYLDFALKHMAGVVKRSLERNVFWAHATRDTYAQLLYRKGKKALAIVVERRALQIATQSDDAESAKLYQSILKEMTEDSL
jgi:hypothetical protein